MNSNFRGSILRNHTESSEDLLCKSIFGHQPNFLPQKLRLSQKNFQNFHIECLQNWDGTPKIHKWTNYYQSFRATARVYRTKQEYFSVFICASAAI